MRVLAILALSSLAAARAPKESATLSIPAHEKDRRYVLAEAPLPGNVAPPFVAKDKDTGKTLACQWDEKTLRVLVGAISAGTKKSIVVEHGEADKIPGMALKDDPGGWISVQAPGREITRYHTGAPAEKHKKPFFYPLIGHGVNVLREYPIGPGKEGETKDHPHHTGMYHAFGEVNGKDYWSKNPIAPKKVLKKEAGPAYARIVAENAWGEDLVETQDVMVLNSGEDAVVDWTITLKAAKDAVLGKDQKMAKEGSFALRLVAGMSQAKGDAPEMMSDSKGNKGEKAIRGDTAPWVDYIGDVEGKKVGVSVMNHPSSFRYPTTWHARAYGLFAANPWYVTEAEEAAKKRGDKFDRVGQNTLAAGETLTIRYRVYVHEGNSAVGKVADVFEGYTTARAAAE